MISVVASGRQELFFTDEAHAKFAAGVVVASSEHEILEVADAICCRRTDASDQQGLHHEGASLDRVYDLVPPFEDPVTLPDGRKLVTLLDAGNYIASLPRKEHESEPWQAAIEALLMAAEDRGPLLQARVGMLRALTRHTGRTFNPDRKETHWGKRKLARDRD